MATNLLILVLAIDPYLFGVNSIFDQYKLILLVFFSTFIIPSFATFLMVKLELAKSFTMEDRMDRVGPLIAAGIFYLWVFYNLFSNPDIPNLYTALLLGATIGLFVVFFFNVFFKISAHMAGIGGWIGALLVIILFQKYQYIILISDEHSMRGITLFNLLAISFVIAGMIGVARLYLNAHTTKEIIYGFLGGLVAMFVGYGIIF